MEFFPRYLFILFSSTIFFEGGDSGTVQTSAYVTATVGSSVDLTCTYTVDSGESVYSGLIVWKAKTSGTPEYENIATFSPPGLGSNSFTTTESAMNLKDRAELLNVTSIGSNTYRAVMRVKEVQYLDEKEYQCSVTFINTITGPQTKTAVTSLTVQECNNGTYGYNCVNNCSGHCLNNSPCNKQTGHCDGGCIPGYTDPYCSKKCSLGHFGVNCRERCSGHCLNDKPCDHVSGICAIGCQDGFIGKYCNKSCDAGTFGENCAFQCSQNCNGTCGYIDGSCTACKIGWKGYNCSEEPMMQNQNESHLNSLVIPFILSLVTNCVLISGVCLLCRGISTKKVSISKDLWSCSKKSINYTDTDVKADENSTYQELDLTREDRPYQNTTIR
ncbi:uncharacterized protein [Magallana gigas]|uniref:uncharacterized protein n=1 Tax=Magallana gigas TaxID=29159 RepID=UPI00333FD7FC